MEGRNKRINLPVILSLSDQDRMAYELSPERLMRWEADREVSFIIRGDIPILGQLILYGNFEGEKIVSHRMDRISREEWAVKIKMPSGGMIRFTFILETEKANYWDSHDYYSILLDPPLQRKLRLYSYIPNGKYSDWKNDMRTIKGMGFNAVHFLPLTSMGYSRSPYAAKHLFEKDDCWGTEDDFNDLLGFCIEEGMALCFDVVLNHVSCDSDMARKKAHWIVGDPLRKDGLKRAGCWHGDSWISWEELVLINYDHPQYDIRCEIWEYMKQYLLYWANLAEKTGGFVRLDNVHGAHRNFLSWAIQCLKRELPGITLLAEFFDSRESLILGVREWGLNLILGNSWEFPFVSQLREYLKMIHASSELRFLLMPTTHDTSGIPQLFGKADSVIPRYFTCALMGTGQTGMTMGTEWGEENKIPFINNSERKEFELRVDYREIISEINNLLRRDSIFQCVGNADFISSSSESLLILRRWEYISGREVLLIANYDINNAQEYFCDSCFETLLHYGFERKETPGGTVIRLSPCGVVAMEMVPSSKKEIMV